MVVVVNLLQPALSELATWVVGQAQTADPVDGQVIAPVTHSSAEAAVQVPPISVTVIITTTIMMIIIIILIIII